MILTVLLRPGLDRALARRISTWIWRMGHREAEFYVIGDHTDAD